MQWSRRTLKFSDKCSAQKGAGHTTGWCFRCNNEKWKDMISEISTSQKPAQMVCASISLDEQGQPQRSPLVIMKRDQNAAKGGYISQSYTQTLRIGLMPYWHRSQLSMQGNTRIHTSKQHRCFLVNFKLLLPIGQLFHQISTLSSTFDGTSSDA